MGHVWGHTWVTWEQQWAIYRGIHGPHGSSNGACMRAYMAIYGGIHGPHGSSNGACMRAYMGHMGAAMGHACAHTWPYMGAYMAHSYPYKLYIASAKRLVQIRHKAWRFLTAFLIVLIFVPLNGGYMRAYMAIYGGIYGPHGSSNGAYMGAYMGHMGAAIGHAYAHTWPYMGVYMGHMGAAMGHTWAHIWATWEQHWGMHARIHGPHGSSNGACMRAYMGHIWGQQWGMHARIHGPYMGAAMGHACAHIWPYMGQPYRESREEGNSREGNPCPVPQRTYMAYIYPYIWPIAPIYSLCIRVYIPYYYFYIAYIYPYI